MVFPPFNRTHLIKLKLKAIRAGIWFKSLPRIDRALVDLTIKVAKNIRSVNLAKGICMVVDKLNGLLGSLFVQQVRTIGFPLAKKVSAIGQRLGNTSANNWSNDESFAVFLTAMHMNK